MSPYDTRNMKTVKQHGHGSIRMRESPSTQQQHSPAAVSRQTTPSMTHNRLQEPPNEGNRHSACVGMSGKPCMKGLNERNWINCDGCTQWFHAACQAMSMEVFKFFYVPDRAYMCLECSSDVADLFKTKDLLKEVGSKMRELE